MTTILHSIIPFPTINFSPFNSLSNSRKSLLNCSSIHPLKRRFQLGFWVTKSRFSLNSSFNEGNPNGSVEVLQVPDHWLEPAKALQESEWLRVALHKWLDDEYCPEPTNIDISKVAANSYYQSLLQKTTDLGEILLKMTRQLESISYQESFHGAFSSANAAVDLIAHRIEQD